MDLKAILASKKIKTEKSNLIRKPIHIANQDRPYAITEIVPQEAESLAADQNKNEHQEDKPATNAQQTGNKLATNWQQTGNKLATNWQQTGNKPATNWQQTSNTICNKLATNWQQTGNKVATNWQQTGNKLATKVVFSELIGLQREITIFICYECKKSRSKMTEPLTLEHIAISLKRNTGAVRTTIQRLEKKGCLFRVGFKNGRGGWTQYEVPDDIYHEVLRIETGNKLATNWQQTGNKLATNWQQTGNKLATELATNASSSSSNIKTTTTELGDEWNFDISSYARFGFTITQLKQLASLGVISAIQVEQSLIEFSYDLDNQALPPIKTNKINFLMGLLRSGHLYVSEAFKNDQEAIIQEMAIRAETKRKNALEAKFSVWEGSLIEEERIKILSKLPTSLMVVEKAYGISNKEIKDWYFDYFIKNIKNE